MIGFLRVADIPKLLIAFVVGGILLVAVGSLFEHFHAHGRLAAVLFLAALAGIFSFSYWAGGAIWERIQDHL
ncbi:MAG: hypothetical protein WA419_02575 [Silvibacterium sp.]